jgi:hypothetical protein
MLLLACTLAAQTPGKGGIANDLDLEIGGRARSATDDQLLFIQTSPGQHQEANPPPWADPGDREILVPIGIGLTADPDTLLFSGAVDFPIATCWTVGPSLQLGLADNRTLVAPTLQVKHHLPLGRLDQRLSRLEVFVLAGIGLAYLERERPRRSDDDDLGLLLDLGTGIRYRLGSRVSVGSQVVVHAMPGEVLGERSYFSWDVLQVVLHL